MKVTPQSQQYGLPERGARALPTAKEVADLMRGPQIPHGTMRRQAAEPKPYAPSGYAWDAPPPHPRTPEDDEEFERFKQEHQRHHPPGAGGGPGTARGFPMHGAYDDGSLTPEEAAAEGGVWHRDEHERHAWDHRDDWKRHHPLPDFPH